MQKRFILNLTRNNSFIPTSFHGTYPNFLRPAVSLSWSFNFKPHSLPMKCYTTHQNIRAVSGVTGKASCLVQTDICVPDYRKGCRHFATSSIPSSDDPVIANVPQSIVEYAENSVRYHYGVDLENMSKESVIAYYSGIVATLQTQLRSMKVLRYRCTARAEIDRLESLYGLDVQFDREKINKIKDPIAKSKEYRFERWVHMGQTGAIKSDEKFYSELLACYTEEEIARLMAEAYHLLSESIKDISLEGIEKRMCKHHLTLKTEVNNVLDILLKYYDFKVGTLE